MGLDPSIYAQLDTHGPVRLAQMLTQGSDPMAAAQKAMAIKSMMGQQQMQDMQMRQAMRQDEQQNALRAIYQQAGADPAALKQKLLDLAAVAEADKHGSKVPQIAAAWLDEILDGTTVDAGADFRKALDRLRAELAVAQRRGEVVVPAGLSVFAGLPSAYRVEPARPEGERRVALADWLTAPEDVGLLAFAHEDGELV